MLETKCVGDNFEMLMTVLVAFVLHLFASDTNIQKMSPITNIRQQHPQIVTNIKSLKLVSNIFVAAISGLILAEMIHFMTKNEKRAISGDSIMETGSDFGLISAIGTVPLIAALFMKAAALRLVFLLLSFTVVKKYKYRFDTQLTLESHSSYQFGSKLTLSTLI